MTDDTWNDPNSFSARFNDLLDEVLPHCSDADRWKLQHQMCELQATFRRYHRKIMTLPGPAEVRRDAERLLGAAEVIRSVLDTYLTADGQLPRIYAWNQGIDAVDFGRETIAILDLDERLEALEMTCRQVLGQEGISEWLSGRDFKENGPGHGPITALLWPVLFHLWDQYGGTKRPSLTRDLETFVTFIHEWMSLAGPNRETLKKAVEAYRKGKIPNALLDKGIFRSIRR